MKRKKEITLWGKDHCVDFSIHSKQREEQRDVYMMERTVMLCLEAAREDISKHVGDEAFAIIMPLLSFTAKRREENGIYSLDIITVMSGTKLRLFEGQKFFEITEDGVRYSTFNSFRKY